MELEAVLAFLKASPDADHERVRRLIMAVQYAIQKQKDDGWRIAELERVIVTRFIRDNSPDPSYRYNPSEDDS